MSLAFNHTIPGNMGSSRPKHVIFADVESYIHPQPDGKTLFEPFLWTAIYRNYSKNKKKASNVAYNGTDILSFWDIVEKHTYQKTKTYLVTHHLEVDFIPLQGIKNLMLRGWVLDKLISHGKVLIMWWIKEHKTLVVMNNGNIFDGSIQAWGEMLGIEKLQMPNESDPMDLWITYCARDTEIMVHMWDFLYTFMDLHDLGNFRITKAGLALNAFRHRFMLRPISIHNHDGAINLERASYKGGRFEALKIGSFTGDTFYSLDVNSMYGYIELTCSLPYELRGYLVTPTLKQLQDRLKKYAVIADVEITIDIPLFPQRITDKIVYKAGTFRTTLTTPELIFCMENNYLDKIYSMCWYYTYPILSAYAKYFLELKEKYSIENNPSMKQFTKLYINSLYGKFAQKGYEDITIGDCDPDIFDFTTCYNADNGDRSTVSRYGGKIHQTFVTEVGYNTFIAIAAHITAEGRLMLYNFMQIAGLDNVYHVATDSIITNQIGFDKLFAYIDNYKPGLLKLEDTFNKLTIKDVNDTVQGTKIKIKGIPKKATQLSTNKYLVTTWPRMITLMKNHEYDQYYTRNVIKVLHREKYYLSLGFPNPDLEK